MKLLIRVETFNRKNIMDVCLKQLHKFKKNSFIEIVDDYSTEYDEKYLEQYSDKSFRYEKKLDISKLKFRCLHDFLNSDYTHLYMTDSDIYHDSNYINFLEKYKSNNLPITLYKSSFIHSFGDGVHKYLKTWDEVSLKTGLYGGCSVFLNREQVQKIIDKLPNTEEEWEIICKVEAWDSKIQRMIDSKRLYLIPNNSMCEHYGQGGKNHKFFNSDYALDPTEYLKEQNKIIIDKIS